MTTPASPAERQAPPQISDESPFFDHDAYAREDCGCGHSRSSHSLRDGRCTRTVERQDTSALPTPQFADGLDFDAFAWPTNWPPVDQIPMATVPCGCSRFYDHCPEEPDDY